MADPERERERDYISLGWHTSLCFSGRGGGGDWGKGHLGILAYAATPANWTPIK